MEAVPISREARVIRITYTRDDPALVYQQHRDAGKWIR